ncbi:MAG: glucosaminidase domain-containing protein [Lewinellaceae bacterium]|nr:glucosaminidase domain-containing protein [Lewinellaceae bacterium]
MMQSVPHTFDAYNNSRAGNSGDAGKEMLSEQLLWKLILLSALAYLVWSDKVSIVLGSGPAADATEHPGSGQVRAAAFDLSGPAKSLNTRPVPEVVVELPSGDLKNTTFAIDPAFAFRNSVKPAVVASRLEKCGGYIARFAPVAVAEMHKFGIPASITLAQGLLESDAGESHLASGTNNHFGIKCFSKNCRKGHCVNYTDDSHKDFFVRYSSAWGSYRAHSEHLKNGRRYRNLFDLPRGDYRSWAHGLAKAGYATDKKYAEKIIAVIQTLGLDAYDKQ